MTITEETTEQGRWTDSVPSDDPQTGPRARQTLADAPTERLEADLTSLAQRLHFGTWAVDAGR